MSSLSLIALVRNIDSLSSTSALMEKYEILKTVYVNFDLLDMCSELWPFRYVRQCLVIHTLVSVHVWFLPLTSCKTSLTS